jgi:hypothetical protein
MAAAMNGEYTSSSIRHCSVLGALVHWHCDTQFSAHQEENMKNPLDTLWGTVITGLVLTAILYFIVKMYI